MIDKISILAADIDNTLTAKGGALPKATVEAFEILHRNGVKLGLATGRELDDKLKNQWAEWNLSFDYDFVVGMNGGNVYDHEHDKLWTMNPLSTSEMREIIEWMLPLIDKYTLSVNCEGLENHNALNIVGELAEAERRHGFYFDDCTGDIDKFCDKPTYKFLFRNCGKYEEEVRERFLSKFSDRYQIVGTFPGTVEVMDKNINKGFGVKMYADWNDIPMSEVITFGDNENDNPMLIDAGWGVCLANGSKESKAISDAITKEDCESGGVGHYLLDNYIIPKGLK